MFGPREVLLTSDNPVITQFVNGRRFGPIGMSEEKDEATLAQERAALADGDADVGTPALMPQLVPSPGLPERLAVQRRMDRVMAMLPDLPAAAQQAILSEVDATDRQGADRDPAHAQAEAWNLAEEPQADEDTAVLEEQDEPGRWPRDWPGGAG
jgi:phospholipid/cholesterol/gamma-HCH transport system ATP-binding protein